MVLAASSAIAERRPMKAVVLNDDPTEAGTAAEVRVLLR
jgi:hypothetical protein